MKKTFYIITCCMALTLFTACNEKKAADGVNPEADSIQDVLNQKMQEMDQMKLFLEAVNTSMDSINSMDGKIVKTSGESQKSVQEQIKDNLRAYHQTLKRQHERIAVLERSAKSGRVKSPEMLHTIEALKKQLQEKDAEIASLNEQLKKKDVDITALQESMAKLNTHVNELTEKNKQQEATIQAQIDEMNEAFYIIGTKRELKSAGIISGGSIFRKPRLTLSEASAHSFRKIDIRKIDKFNIPGIHPQILTQEPPTSYNITRNGDGTCTLTINDPAKFWYYTNYLVIRY